MPSLKVDHITPRHFLYRPLAASEGVTERAQDTNNIAMRQKMINWNFIGLFLTKLKEAFVKTK
jgi:hypothetical protein